MESTSAPNQKKRQLTSLTGLRFLAALHVLLFHAYGGLSNASVFQLLAPLENWFLSGYVGVSLFFVLSGFILAYNYLGTDLKSSTKQKSFWISRLARVYPIYLLGLLVAAPKFFHNLMGLGDAAVGTAFAGVSVISLTQAWSPHAALQWNAPGWSLSAEAFFYLLFPFLALRLQHLKQRGALIFMAVCWVIALVPPALFYSFASGSQVWASVIKFNPLVRLPEFIIGICLGRFLMCAKSASVPSSASRFGPISITVIILCALLLQDRVPKLFMHNALMVPLFAWLIFSLAQPNRDPLARLLSSPTLILLGEASYALYILHVPIKGLMTFAAERFVDLSDPLVGSLFLLAYLAVTITASLIAFKLVEVPARRWIRNRFSAQSSLAPQGSYVIATETEQAARTS